MVMLTLMLRFITYVRGWVGVRQEEKRTNSVGPAKTPKENDGDDRCRKRTELLSINFHPRRLPRLKINRCGGKKKK
ncbi:hypothetical protein BDQ94DRAFT_143753 [Aspergillus welwitschiae]|uniref:Secreted protein n=1 Tax=Aspergillus welwitschiae TaxID=1341132 RepID=A0A3F3Q213_9EURO|nr:hypothetical protein BDQ94DRAFT_143753 [Aspergillus welwitschiae]RDH33181.1 hypothetical protein BDQ94DRAFT_143753 [Aspergillus welwitschiae]